MPPLPPPEIIAALALVIFFAIGLHEYAHCKFADMAGDPTPGIYGRVTLKLWKHFEPTGTIMIAISSLAGYGIGWGRPAPINSSKMRNPRADLFAAVAAGPISNVLQALLYAVALRLLVHSGTIGWAQVIQATDRGGIRDLPPTTFLAALVSLGVLTNLSLALFNLIPLGPLDGHWLVGCLLPERQSILWNQWHRKYGGQILIAIVLIGQFSGFSVLGIVIGPVLFAAFRLFTGAPF